MKKIIQASSILFLAGLGYLSSLSMKIDNPLLLPNKDDTYIIEVKGDLLKDSKKNLERYRNEAICKVKYSLQVDDYKITNVYDTVFNGFAIKTSGKNINLLKSLPNVINVQKSHTYEVEADINASNDKGLATKAERLKNYSAISMHAVTTEISGNDIENSKQGTNVTIGIIDTGLFSSQVEGSDDRKEVVKRAAKKQVYDANDENLLNKPAFKDISGTKGVDYKYDIDDCKRLLEKTDNSFTNYASHINNKIFFARDYANNDNNVSPKNNGYENPDQAHGTHVASIAAANGVDFKGIAPNAQLAIFKVFGDGDGGAATNAIIDALNDAAKLKLDVVNLSLGSDLTTDGDSKDDATFKAIQACNNAGTIVNWAAGNAGKGAFSGSNAYSDWACDTIETSILGSSAHFDEGANIIGSSNNTKAFYESYLTIKGAGSTIEHPAAYSDQCKKTETQKGITNRPLAGLLENGETSHEFDFYFVPGLGRAEDYKDPNTKADVDLTGKIAVVKRGTTTFVQKFEEAEKHHAIAMICINNDASVNFNFSMDFNDHDPHIPVVFVFRNTTEYFGTQGTYGKIKIGVNSVNEASDGNTVSSFSSDGGEYNLDIGIDCMAPGKSIIGAVNADYYLGEDSQTALAVSKLTGYENYNGTSMAAPNFTGALALYLGEKNPTNNGTYKVADETAYLKEKQAASFKAQSNADQLLSTEGDNVNASVRMQGAGIINVAGMLSTDSYLTSTDPDTDFNPTVDSSGAAVSSSREQAKVELKNKDNTNHNQLFTDFNDNNAHYLEFSYKIHNDSDVSKTFKPSLNLLIPKLRIKTTHKQYADEVANNSTSLNETLGYDEYVQFIKSDLSTYPKGVGKPTMSINEDQVEITSDHIIEGSGLESDITVSANSTEEKTIKVRIDDLKFTKDLSVKLESSESYLNGPYEKKFEGTLKDYFKEFFKDSGGSLVEGYLTLDDTSKTAEDEKALNQLTMPYLGFYGDYTKGEAVEDFDKKEDRIYNSELVDNYVAKGLNETYRKSNAYTGSTICVAEDAPTNNSLLYNMRGSYKVDNAKYMEAGESESDHSTLYVGAPKYRYMIANFFVNRSLSKAEWSIKSGNSIVTKGSVNNTLPLNGTGDIIKSFLIDKKTQDNDSTVAYQLNQALAVIDLSKVKNDGEYTLQFDFKLKANDQIQSKTYKLIYDSEAPTYLGTKIEKTEDGVMLTTQAKGANSVIGFKSFREKPIETEKGSDIYTVTTNIDILLEDNPDKILITYQDYSHNSLTVLINPNYVDEDNNVIYAVSSTFFTSDDSFEFGYDGGESEKYKDSGETIYKYEIDLRCKGGSANAVYDLSIYVGTDFDKDDLRVFIDDEEIETDEFDFDQNAGILTIHLKLDSRGKYSYQETVALNVRPNVANAPKSTDTGLILGLVLGIVGGLLLIGGVVFLILFLIKKSKKKAEAN